MLKPSALTGRTYLVPVFVLAIVGILLGWLMLSSKASRPATAKSVTHAFTPQTVAQSTSLPIQAGNAAQRKRIQAAFAALPLAFEKNEGQTDAQVKYLARGNGYKFFLTSSEAIFNLHKRGGDSEVRSMMMHRKLGAAGVRAELRRQAQHRSKALIAAVHMRMLGADPNAKMAANGQQLAKMHYFVGRDPSKWHSEIPLFGQVRYENIYRDVDLVFHGNQRALEFDYLVHPGGSAKSIALGFSGTEELTTNVAGDLLLATAAGPMEMRRPVAYQEKDGVREPVEVSFQVSKNEVTFSLGNYDHGRELVIDPTVSYSTYFGGDFADYGSAITADANGNAYIAGATDSDSIPGDSKPTDAQSFDVFVTEISNSGSLVFTTEFGGSGDDFPGGIAIDPTGNIYVSGTTDSSDFPVTAGTVQQTFLGGVSAGDNDAFAVKIDPQGPSILWGTYIGGSDSDSGLAIAVDSNSNVYVVGETFSSNLGGATGGINPLPNGSALNLGQVTSPLADDGYIVKLNSSATAYLLVSYLGGTNGDLATGVALDPTGNIYVSGETISADLPVTAGVVQKQCGTDGTCNASGGNLFDDAFVVGIQASLAGYQYLTYYGGSNVDDALAIAADASGDAYITGNTASTDFTTAGTPFQSSLTGTQNAFAVELNPTGTAAVYGSYLGGSGTEFGYGIALDTQAPPDIYVTGQTSSSDFPLVNPTQGTFGGSTDAFVTVLSPSQKLGLFSTYLGGGGDEDQLSGAVALDSANNNIYVTGDTTSGNGTTAVFPTLDPVTGGGTYGGGSCLNSDGTPVPCTDAFVTAYGPATAPDFILAATIPTSVSPGSSGTSTVTLTALNAYASPVNLTCSVAGSGSPLPACAASSFATNPLTPTASGATSTLTITTTGATSALVRPSRFFYAMWLPVAGISLLGMRINLSRNWRKGWLGLLMLGIVTFALILMPACGGGGNSNSGGGGGGGTGTPAGNYMVTITATGTDSATTTHTTTVTLTVN